MFEYCSDDGVLLWMVVDGEVVCFIGEQRYEGESGWTIQKI